MTWVLADGYSDPSDKWNFEPLAYDDDKATKAYSAAIYPGNWGGWLILTFSTPVKADKLKVFLAPGNQIDINAVIDDVDTDVFEGTVPSYAWVEKTFSEGLVSQIRIRFYGYTSPFIMGHVYEMQLWEVPAAPTTALQDYFDFVMTHAPYFYWLPDTEEHDPNWGRGASVAAFAIDFLYECYNDSRFESEKTNIYNKIVSLADFILTQQCTDPAKDAYGGFKSTETSNSYYSVDACRVIPGLLHAYALTNTVGYLNAAKLAGGTFLKTMQDKQTYGGFARAVDINDAWLLQMDIECLYGLIGLKMLAETYDTANKTTYENMMSTLVGFLREGFEGYWLYYDPADDKWHRIGLDEEQIYDDPFSYALLGLYDYEGRSLTVERVYEFINTISASADYPGYNPYICWSGYIDVVTRRAACDYYDGVTSGILWALRSAFDKPSLALTIQIIEDHVEEFKYWGVEFIDFSPEANLQSTVTVSWLGHLFLNYQAALTSFTRILNQYGENVELLMIVQAGEPVSYYDPIAIKGVVRNTRVDEIIIEPGYMITDFLAIYTFIPIRHHDKIRRHGVDYEVMSLQLFRLEREPLYFKSVCRRLLG